jgi:hypothetical protein
MKEANKNTPSSDEEVQIPKTRTKVIKKKVKKE